jgi:large subunit ribosomal protein L23
MADITDIKSILYTEKTLGLQESGVVVIQTSPRVTKTGLKEIFLENFGIFPTGKQNNFKKFYVTLPEGAQIESLAV